MIAAGLVRPPGRRPPHQPPTSPAITADRPCPPRASTRKPCRARSPPETEPGTAATTHCHHRRPAPPPSPSPRPPREKARQRRRFLPRERGEGRGSLGSLFFGSLLDSLWAPDHGRDRSHPPPRPPLLHPHRAPPPAPLPSCRFRSRSVLRTAALSAPLNLPGVRIRGGGGGGAGGA